MLPPVDHVLTFKAVQQSDAPVSLEEAVEAVAQLDIEERETTHGWGHRVGGGGFGELARALTSRPRTSRPTPPHLRPVTTRTPYAGRPAAAAR